MTRQTPANERFLSRWSRLKHAQAGSADAASVPPVQPPVTAPHPAAAPAAPAAGEGAAPLLPSIESLTMESDYAQFFQPKVPEALRRAAVKKLFADPHFNVMDGLDTYIDDYSKSDPIPPEMLARLVQARDIIDHPSNAKPESADQAPATATNEAVGQPDAQATALQPEGVAAGQPEEQVAAGGPRAAALEGQPPAELSIDINTDVSNVPDSLARPAGTAA
jgi:hypothetical protein